MVPCISHRKTTAGESQLNSLWHTGYKYWSSLRLRKLSCSLTLYMNDCRNQYTNYYMMKFSDDTAILSLLTKDLDIAVYESQIEKVVQWCEGQNLMLNVKKTKEMVFDPRSDDDHSPVWINGESWACSNIQVFTLIFSYIGLIKWSMSVHKWVSVCIFCGGSGSMEWIKALCYCSTGQPLIYYSLQHHNMVW